MPVKREGVDPKIVAGRRFWEQLACGGFNHGESELLSRFDMGFVFEQPFIYRNEGRP